MENSAKAGIRSVGSERNNDVEVTETGRRREVKKNDHIASRAERFLRVFTFAKIPYARCEPLLERSSEV